MRLCIVTLFALGAFSRVSVFLCHAASPSPEPALTNVAAILQLPAARAAAELPVHLTATVTYADVSGGILFVEDESGGIFVGTKRALPALRSGELVEIDGRSDPGLHLPTIMQATIKSRGRGPRLPVRPALEDLVAGRFDCRFVEIYGVVRQVGENRGRALLQIEAGNGQLVEASFLQLAATNLWEATVRVRGVCGLRGMKDGRVLAIMLYCSNDEALTMEHPGLPDAFALRGQTIAAVAARKDLRRARIDGRIAEISEAGTITVVDARGERLSLEAPRSVLLRTNDRVNVSGIPVMNDDRLALRYLEVRAMAPTRRGGTNASASSTAPVLTRVSQIRRLGERASRGCPVRIRGSITYYDGAWMLFMQDDTGGIYIYPGSQKFPLRAGQIVEVEGFTHSGSYAPMIYEPRFVVMGESELPEARALTAEALWRGQFDSQRVEVSGVVCSIAQDSDGLARIDLLTSAGRLKTFLLLNGAHLPPNLIDAEVRLRGVCGSTFNQRRQFIGPQLYIASTNGITIEQPAPADLFAIADQAVTNLLKFGSSSMHRVKISGTVTFVDPHESLLCVQDASGGIFVRPQPWADVKLGDAVEALGFPITAGYTPNLSQAAVRTIGRGAEIIPKVLRTVQARSGAYDAELVTLEARLLDRFPRNSNDVLVLKAGEITFEAEKPQGDGDGWLEKLQPQSNLRLTGVCVVQLNRTAEPRSFKLLLRSPSDVRVLSVPAWWNDFRFRIVAASAGLIILTPAFWVVVLRRKVREQTAIIREQLEREQRQNDELETKVHELEHSEHALRLSEEQFSKAFRCSPVPMSISRIADGRYIDVNDAYANMLGFTRKEIMGGSSVELGIWPDVEERARTMQALREKRTVRDWDLKLRSKAGDLRHVLASAETTVVNNEDCLIAILNDVTGRVELEAQLRQSQKMEAVGQLAAGIAHDFNNMLTVILGHVSLLEAQSRDPDKLNSLAEIGDTANRAAGLTQQLLTFSRRQPFQPKSVDVNEIIGGTSRMLQRILGELIVLRLQRPASLPSVFADRGMIEQIIMNLAVNARDAMPKGGELKFTTSLRRVEENYLQRNAEARIGSFVCMTISDTGCGMDASTLSRVFEPFFTTKDVGKGTGLGLATVYGIVKQHNGWIEVSSQPGRGTVFDVYLPIENKTVTASGESAIEVAVRGGKETILLVEDESGVRDLACGVLCRYGYEVLTAANGPEAIELWQKHGKRIDLLLTDMVMPEGVGGRDLASRLLAEHPELKVIYTSGYTVELAQNDVMLQDGLNFLPKPYPARKLATVVRNCLDD